MVVDNHFQPTVEHLIRGQTSQYVGGDIDFTLRAIPNHPNALMSMMLLGEKEKSSTPRGSRYSVECWFERAIRFRPDDNVVRMIYANFLTKKKRGPLIVFFSLLRVFLIFQRVKAKSDKYCI